MSGKIAMNVFLMLYASICYWQLCEGALFKETCGDMVKCTESGTVCQNGTCVCDGNNYRSIDNSSCVIKVDMHGICPMLPAVSVCSDPYANCIPSRYGDNRCHCVNSAERYTGTKLYCANGGLLGENCSNINPHISGSCAESNARCSWFGHAALCICASTHYDNNGVRTLGGNCVPKVGIGESCPAIPDTAPCADESATCVVSVDDTYRCQCKDTHYDNREDGENRACVEDVDLGYSCWNPDMCRTPNAICRASVCVCEDGYLDSNGADELLGSCIKGVTLGGICSGQRCSDPHARCYLISPSVGGCYCLSSYSNIGGICVPDRPNGHACPSPDGSRPCSDRNAECINFNCTCGSEYYDDNAFEEGGDCKHAADLQVTSIVFTNIQTTEFTVQWTEPVGKAHLINGYTVHFVPLDGSIAEISADVGKTTNFTVETNVNAGKAYNIVITSRNELTQHGGLRTANASKEQAAKPNPASAINKQLSRLDAEDKQIHVVWTASTGIASGYIVTVLDGDKEKVQITVPATPQASLYFDSMKNGYIYYIHITAISELFAQEHSVKSDPYIEGIKTVVKVPSPPRDVVCIEEVEDNIRLTWRPPSFPNGNIVMYHVRTFVYPSHEVVGTINTTETFADITELRSGSRYSFEVTVENEMYNSSSSEGLPSFCATKEDASRKPKNISVLDISPRSVKVSWSMDSLFQSVTGYMINAIPVEPAKRISHTSHDLMSRSYILTDLEEFWNYTVVVAAVTADGPVTSDEIIQHTTLPGAPGRVPNLTVNTLPGGDESLMIIYWNGPDVLNMNGIITDYIFTDTVVTTGNTTLFPAMHSAFVYTKEVHVIPGDTYSFMVNAVNIHGIKGETTALVAVAPSKSKQEHETGTQAEDYSGERTIFLVVIAVLGTAMLLMIVVAAGAVWFKCRTMPPKSSRSNDERSHEFYLHPVPSVRGGYDQQQTDQNKIARARGSPGGTTRTYDKLDIDSRGRSDDSMGYLQPGIRRLPQNV